jgi:hypothetical protein
VPTSAERQAVEDQVPPSFWQLPGSLDRAGLMSMQKSCAARVQLPPDEPELLPQAESARSPGAATQTAASRLETRANAAAQGRFSLRSHRFAAQQQRVQRDVDGVLVAVAVSKELAPRATLEVAPDGHVSQHLEPAAFRVQ